MSLEKAETSYPCQESNHDSLCNAIHHDIGPHPSVLITTTAFMSFQYSEEYAVP